MILADAHVHIHAEFALDDVLNAASGNFMTVSPPRRNGLSHRFLLLSETRGNDGFHRLRSAAEDPAHGPVPGLSEFWRLRPTGEAISVAAERCDDPQQRIFLVAGWQIVTRERLELLALCSHRRPAEGLPLEPSVDSIRQTGGIPVAPWGVGKWLGRRGVLLERLLRRVSAPFWLGDNGGRPAFWPTPGLFRAAKRMGIGVLPGSDPLPLPSEVGRIGSYGFRLQADVDPERPAETLRRHLSVHRSDVESFGRRQGIVSFWNQQLRLRLHRRPG